MSDFNNSSLEDIADELYTTVKEIKEHSLDPEIIEKATTVIRHYKQLKNKNEDVFTPMLPGYEYDLDDSESLFKFYAIN